MVSIRTLNFTLSSKSIEYVKIILLVGRNTFLVTLAFQLMLSHLSCLEMGGMRLLTSSQLDFFPKSCLIFKGHQHQNQKPSLRINFLPRKFFCCPAVLESRYTPKNPGPNSIC